MADDDLIEFMAPFNLTDKTLFEIYRIFCEQLRMGLNRETHPIADTKCFITYVHDLPTGNEIGKSLGLDLGGTNFRVLLVELLGDGEATLTHKIYTLSKETITGPGAALFDYIAECLADFTKEHKLEGLTLPLGFTFSFPCRQERLTKAILVKWTKGFTCPDVAGHDVGQMLTDAVKRRGDLDIDVVAVLNDTTGTLMSCAYRVPNCRIGLIVGTGCNACYWENVKCVDTLDEEIKSQHKNVIINIEWGAFGEGGCLDFIRTDIDREIDDRSPNPKNQLFEKLISGMYLGAMLRCCLRDAIKAGLLLKDAADKNTILEALSKHEDIIEARVVSEIDSDKGVTFEHTKTALKEIFDFNEIGMEDLRKIKYISECISKRSAHLIGATLSALVNKINEQDCNVAIDGSVYRYHPKYDSYIREKMRRFVNPKIDFDIILSDDGSGRGAALVAAVAAQTRASIKSVVPKPSEGRSTKTGSVIAKQE